jgi:hypothetical protein
MPATLNEIRGLDHGGTARVGTPAIFGMNFQSVSTAEKLPVSEGKPGGYLPDGTTPGPVLAGALDFIDRQVASFVAAIDARHLARSTAIVLSAKHGQSPQDPAALTRIPDGPIIDALNAAWQQAAHTSANLVAFSVDDDAMLLWLSDRSERATRFAKAFLLAQSGTGNDIAGSPKPYASSGLQTIYAGEAASDFFNTAADDSRVPDVFGIAQHGVVYTGGKGKIAEHGGSDPQDRDVPLVVSGDPVGGPDQPHGHGAVERERVETTQIAPTILKLLGLNPDQLEAVGLEHTRALRLG